MSTQAIIIIIAILIVFAIAATQMRRSPRVTQITREVRKDEDSTDA
jgi:hypothetical protein